MLDEIFCPQLNITYKCNLTCSYCYEQEFAYKDKIMNLEQRCPVRKLRNTGIREKIVRNHVLRRYFS